MKIGYVSENWGHEICYSSVSELTNLPKVSYASIFADILEDIIMCLIP